MTIITSGTRKRATARASLAPGKGMVRFNGQRIDAIHPKILQTKLLEPLIIAGDAASKVNIDVKVHGGGQIGQIEAARLAIGRALAEFGGAKVREELASYDRHLLVADTRRKEQCKPNDSKARAKRQFSKR